MVTLMNEIVLFAYYLLYFTTVLYRTAYCYHSYLCASILTSVFLNLHSLLNKNKVFCMFYIHSTQHIYTCLPCIDI